MSGKKISVAAYLTQQISISPKSQQEITNDLGLENANIITMMKQGKTKVPVNRVPGLAKSLGIDPIYLLSLVMGEYMPETWEAIRSVLNSTLITDYEKEVLGIIREESGGMNVRPETAMEKEALRGCVRSWIERETAEIESLKNIKDMK